MVTETSMATAARPATLMRHAAWKGRARGYAAFYAHACGSSGTHARPGGPILQAHPFSSYPLNGHNAALQVRRALAGSELPRTCAPAVACERWLGCTLHNTVLIPRKVVGQVSQMALDVAAPGGIDRVDGGAIRRRDGANREMLTVDDVVKVLDQAVVDSVVPA